MRKLNLISTLLTILFLTVITSCKDDSTSSNQPVIEISQVSATIVDLNDCSIDSNDPATRYNFMLEYDASSEVSIDGVEFDLNWSNGDESPNIFANDVNVEANTVDFNWCFRYGSTDWFELDLKILAEDEQIESNEFNLRVDKPNGANKSSQ